MSIESISPVVIAWLIRRSAFMERVFTLPRGGSLFVIEDG